jgi:hypothetical protein
MRPAIFFATILCASLAAATEWQVLGPRATAMGGAGVALPQGAQSAYWNPASLSLSDNPSGLQLPVGAHLGVTGTVLAGANDLKQVSDDCNAQNSGCTQANISNALNELNNPNNGVRGDVAGGAGVKVGRISIFVNDFFLAGGKPLIDMAHNGTNPAVAATFVGNNTSKIQLNGINVTEVGVAYGHEVPRLTGLHAGVALKGMFGRTGFQQYTLSASDPGSTGLGNLMQNSRTSFQPGLDVGLLWSVNRTFESAWFKPRVGVTARNVNNPKFKNPDAAVAAGASGKYSLQGNARMGVAITPLSFWNVAVDADLTKNITAVEGVKQQSIGLGTEFNVFNRSWINIPLRAGLSKNLAQRGSKTALAAGVGLNFLHVNFDVGASVTPASERVQTQGSSKKLPNELGVAGQFSLSFGGSSDEDLGPTAPK